MCRIYFLKEEPREFGQAVHFSDYYGGNKKYGDTESPKTIAIRSGLRKDTVIPSDCQYIIITGVSWNGTNYIEQAPVVLYLCNSDYLYEDGDYETSAERSNRDVNIFTQKFMHWNIGHFSNGGTHTNIETQKEYDIRQPAYNNFFRNYVHDCHRLFNEYDDIFAVIDGREIYTRNALDTKKAYVEFPKSHNYHQIACYFGNQLIDYSYGLFNSLKGFVSDTESGGSRLYISHYGCGYSLSRYSIGNIILTVMHFHLPIGLNNDIEVRDKLFTEIINISSKYGAVVLVGDFNVTRKDLVHNDHVNFEDAGFTILNPLVDGEDIPTFPSNGRTYDWVLYKVPSSVTLYDFHVCTEATYTDGEGVYLLSDHWPISFSVSVGQSPLIDKNIGSYRFNNNEKAPEWFDGQVWKNVFKQAENYLNPIEIPENTNISTLVTKGNRYFSKNATVTRTLSEIPLGVETSFILDVIPSAGLGENTSFMQVLYPNNLSGIFIRIFYSPTNKGAWLRIPAVAETYKQKGTLSERPSIKSNPTPNIGQDLYSIGYYYFATDIGKPIWWNGDGWVDATGTTIP